jgi:putative phage-type endonuclease
MIPIHLNRKLRRLSTKGMDEDIWRALRLQGIGGSYSGVILGENPWMRPIELFHLYLGTIPQQQEQKEQAFHGTNLEDYVATLWKCYDGDIAGMQRNYKEGKYVQLCQRVNAIISNPDYPHLNANIDREITRSIAGVRGILECKTIDKFAADRYELGYPPSYYTQVQHYMLVTEADYAEMAMLMNGNTFQIFQFQRDEEKIKELLHKTAEFWDRIAVARDIMLSDLDKKKKHELLMQVEPEPDGTDACEKFLKKRFQQAELGTVMQAELEHIQWAMAYNEALRNEQKWAEEKVKYANKFRQAMGEVEIIDFGGAGKVYYRGEKVRKLEVKVKDIAISAA